MKQGFTIATRGVVFLMGLAAFSVCAILLPELAREEAVAHPDSDRTVLPFLIGAWLLAVPIFLALFQTLKLLNFIDKDEAFSNASVKALEIIKTCAIAFSIMIVLGAITIVFVAKGADPSEDVTPVITIGFFFTFVSSVVATFVAVLKRLLQDAINMKSENDLTV